jgi:hypothetical protein
LHGGVMHMINQRRILALLLSLFLTMGAGPAWAVSFIRIYEAERRGTFGDEGVEVEEMTESDTTFCVLTRVSVRETDTLDEEATCQLADRGDVWLLEAGMGVADDAEVFCEAACFTND